MTNYVEIARKIVSASLKQPEADGIACPEIAGYNDHIIGKEKDTSVYRKPARTGSPEASRKKIMVIVSKYDLIEKPQTGVFC